ncbi:MAG: hypothetical protein FH753_00930 [Firmicutes bacterium]|nr:hypothetical protein [Bacillota bacterium]
MIDNYIYTKSTTLAAVLMAEANADIELVDKDGLFIYKIERTEHIDRIEFAYRKKAKNKEDFSVKSIHKYNVAFKNLKNMVMEYKRGD